MTIQNNQSNLSAKHQKLFSNVHTLFIKNPSNTVHDRLWEVAGVLYGKQRNGQYNSQSIPPFIDSLKNHLPVIENEVHSLIKRKSKNRKAIEKRLEILLLLNMHGIADDLFSRLLEYNKTMNISLHIPTKRS